MTIQVNIMSYKYGHLVAQAIESVLAQSWPADRILVVDDGVGDCSFVKDMYPDVELIERPKNMGIVPNFNDILQNHTSTDKVMFLGADNYLRPDCLEKLIESEADVVSYNISIFGQMAEQFAHSRGITKQEHGLYIWEFEPTDINLTNYIHGSALYDVAKAKEHGYKPSGGLNSEEDWMLFRAMLNNGATLEHIPEPMLYYRRHVNNFQKI